MNKINREETKDITGGFSITGTMLNAVSKALNTFYELGVSLGNSLSRTANKSYCTPKAK